ncbi:MAG TPA: hypothetical protein PK733_11860 [Clostridiales bacterium]|nr:hypothetical protein [Clostridiales bacterium]
MKITLVPKTALGKWSVILSIAFIVFIALKTQSFFPLPSFSIAALGLAGFVVGIIAIIKKDRALLFFIPILVGLVIILWIAGELIYPH